MVKRKGQGTWGRRAAAQLAGAGVERLTPTLQPGSTEVEEEKQVPVRGGGLKESFGWGGGRGFTLEKVGKFLRRPSILSRVANEHDGGKNQRWHPR